MNQPKPVGHNARLGRLREWLETRKAKALWSTGVANVGDLTAYSVVVKTPAATLGRIVYVMVYLRERGFEILVAPEELSIDDTFAAADEMLGVPS